MSRISGLLCALGLGLLAAAPGAAQTVASVRGVVTDELGGVMPGVTIHVVRALSGLDRVTTSGAGGEFAIGNLPLDEYEIRAEMDGFEPYRASLRLLTSVPAVHLITLAVAAQSAAVRVMPEAPLVDPTRTGTRAEVTFGGIERLPAPVGSRGIESALTSLPGFAQNANGAIHPRGAHNQMTYVVDGLPISDQLTGAFANALDGGLVQAAQLWTGNIPAEFGGKVSGVVVITSQSGAGTGRPLSGEVTLAGGGFGTWQGAAQAGGEAGRVGYFASATSMRTERFLDQVSRDNLHNDGAFARGFARADIRLGEGRWLRLHAMGGRSAFELAHLRSQEANGQDQRQRLADGAGWLAYHTPVGTVATLEAVAGYRGTMARLLPSAGDTPVTAHQHRTLGTTTATVRGTRLFGRHHLRAGVDVMRFQVRESFGMAITSPTFNDEGAPSFNDALIAHDLTRGGVPFQFDAARRGHHLGAFAQGQWQWRQMVWSLGVRYDHYALIVREAQVQPRVGMAVPLPGERGIFRVSYNRNLQTPPLENLLLSSSPAAAALAPASVKAALGNEPRPLRAERQDVLEVGYQRRLGRWAALDVSTYWKRSRDQQDNNNFFDTGVIFPTTLARIDVKGAEARVVVPERRGVSGTLSATTGRAISTPPFTGGLFLGQEAVDLLSAGPFAIDHDQRLSLHATAQWRHPRGWWLGGSARYDSGLVANPSDPAEVAADPDFADLLPLVNLDATIPRVRPRTIIDMAAGLDLGRAGRRAWSLQVQVTNLFDRAALYNFQSVFVGTRLVQPRTVAFRLKRGF
jgi:hypothetical protein